MRVIKAAKLAKNLGISPRTVTNWCVKIPSLAYKRDGEWWIKLDELAKRDGFDVLRAYTIDRQQWVKAVDFARAIGRPIRTVIRYCKQNQRYAMRIGQVWYIDISEQDERLQALVAAFQANSSPKEGEER